MMASTTSAAHLGLTLLLATMAAVSSDEAKNNPEDQFGRGDYYPNCADDLGSFEITPDFNDMMRRPINLKPATREKINTKFAVFTRTDPKTTFNLRVNDMDMLEKSKFDNSKKTKIIVHGFLDSQLEGIWMNTMKDNYLLEGDYNVIIVDWSGGNKFPYTQATANTRVVGAEIACLISWLQNSAGVNLADVHILGHSLGAHIAGYAGARLNKIGRITGMDPAGPNFLGMPPSVRLDPTDADFVDAIHSNAHSMIGLGTTDLVGHVDFFPNGGYRQPGCTPDRFTGYYSGGFNEGTRTLFSCEHQRSVDFMSESINQRQCVFTGFACADWDTFQEGKCASCGERGDGCAHMGAKASDYYYKFRNDSRQQAFYLQTGSNPPFCLYQFQVTLTLQSNVGKDQKGDLTLKLRGDKGETTLSLQNGGNVLLQPGSTNTFFVTSNSQPGQISSVSFSWTSSVVYNVFSEKEIYLKTIKIVSMNVVEPDLRGALERTYCAKKVAIGSKKEVTFKSEDLC